MSVTGCNVKCELGVSLRGKTLKTFSAQKIAVIIIVEQFRRKKNNELRKYEARMNFLIIYSKIKRRNATGKRLMQIISQSLHYKLIWRILMFQILFWGDFEWMPIIFHENFWNYFHYEYLSSSVNKFSN